MRCAVTCHVWITVSLTRKHFSSSERGCLVREQGDQRLGDDRRVGLDPARTRDRHDQRRRRPVPAGPLPSPLATVETLNLAVGNVPGIRDLGPSPASRTVASGLIEAVAARSRGQSPSSAYSAGGGPGRWRPGGIGGKGRPTDPPDAARVRALDEVRHDHGLGVTVGSDQLLNHEDESVPRLGSALDPRRYLGSGPLRGTIFG